MQGIRDFIALDSPHYARLVVQEILAAVDQLAQFPGIGRIVPELGDPDVRERVAGAFRIVYRHRGDAVEIVTVFRASRLFPIKE